MQLPSLPDPKSIVTLSVEDTINKLASSWNGLSSDEAAERLAHFGENHLEKRYRLHWVRILLHQFSDILIWILLTASFFSFIFGDFRHAGIILAIVILNAAIGFAQEYKAERILDRLRDLETKRTVVVRDGERREIDSRELVPGDIVALSAGSAIPADLRVLESFSLKINTVLFSGETHPRKRSAEAAESGILPLADTPNMLLSGESIATGETRAIVVATGGGTALGELASLTAGIVDDPTPLQKKMSSLGRNTALLSLIIGIIVIAIGRNYGLSWYDNFLLALAIAVSIVPEGLPAAISIAFALGMKRLLKFNVLAKKLNAVETLGSVSTICTDKTGTITKGELTVTKLVIGTQIYEISGNGYEPIGGFFRDGKAVSPAMIPGAEMLFKIGVLANSASLSVEQGRYRVLGDGTEGAILVASRKYHPDPEFFRLGEIKLSENPFTSERMRMSAIFRNSSVVSYVKGSPDILLPLSTHRYENGTEMPFPESEKAEIKTLYNKLSEDALRLLAFAYRPMNAVSESHYEQEMERHLVWVGMMAMADPARPGARDAMLECQRLGLRVVMITGDSEVTARAIGRNVGLIAEGDSSEVVSGAMLHQLSDAEIVDRIRKQNAVFARITPEQKLRIATALKTHGEVIAMTGDGVNDAPALKKADIGVAMGQIGTDVSKEAADMILLDDNFANIMRGVREGRTIFSNLKKFAHYIFTANVGQLSSVLIGFGLGIPSPIAAVQILAISLGTDVFPSLALGVEPEEPNSSRVRGKSIRSIIDWNGVKRLMKFGILMAIGGVIAFLLSMLRGGWQWGAEIDLDSDLYQKSTAATYTTLALTQMANLLQSRSATLPFFSMPLFSNPWIWISMAASIFLLWLFTSSPLQSILAMQTPDMLDWAVAISFTVFVFIYEEVRKRGEQKRSRNVAPSEK